MLKGKDQQAQAVMWEIRMTLFGLMQRTMGFIVGWVWYDTLGLAFGLIRALGLCSSCWIQYVYLALTATTVSFLWIAAFGKPPPVGSSAHRADQAEAERREQAERIFLANALGLMQGWAWSDVVGVLFRNIQKMMPGDILIQVATSFFTTAVLTSLVITVRSFVVVSPPKTDPPPQSKSKEHALV